MKKMFIRISVTVIVLLLSAEMFLFCGSNQAYETAPDLPTDGRSYTRREGSLEIMLPSDIIISSVNKDAKTGSNTELSFQSKCRIEPDEDRNLSPPDVGPTSDDQARTVPNVPSVHHAASDLADKTRVSKAELHVRPTTTIDSTGVCVSLTTRILVKMVSSFTAGFKRSFHNHGIQAHTSIGNSPLPAPNSDTASDGKLRRQGRSLLRDISPPGMWPITSDDGDEIEHYGRYLMAADPSFVDESGENGLSSTQIQRKRGRALLRDISPPRTWPITSDDDESAGTRRRALLITENSPSHSPAEDNGPDLKRRKALLRDIFPPGMWPIGSDDDDEFEDARRALLSVEKDSTVSESESESRNYKHGRALLRDISPPGMWPVTSDDDEFEFTRRRALLSHDNQSSSSSAEGAIAQRYKRTEAHLRDSGTFLPEQSPSGGQGSKHRRSLLRDISPPGMWPTTPDDDELEFVRRRALLSDGKSSLALPSARSDVQHHKHRRSLLRDISPPGMWVTSDDNEFGATRRRALLSVGENKVAAHQHHRHRRSLLRDISPPGMWPITSDDDEFHVSRRRALLSDVFHLRSSAIRSRSNPHQMSTTDDYEVYAPKRSTLST